MYMSDELTSAVGTVLTRKTLLVYGKGFHSASWSGQWRHQSGATSPTVSGHLSTCFTRVWPSCLGVKLHPLRPASSRNFRNLTVKRLLLPSSITVRVHPFHVFNPTSLHSPSTPLVVESFVECPNFRPRHGKISRVILHRTDGDADGSNASANSDSGGLGCETGEPRHTSCKTLRNMNAFMILYVHIARIWHMIACDGDLGKWWKMQNAFWPEVILRILLQCPISDSSTLGWHSWPVQNGLRSTCQLYCTEGNRYTRHVCLGFLSNKSILTLNQLPTWTCL